MARFKSRLNPAQLAGSGKFRPLRDTQEAPRPHHHYREQLGPREQLYIGLFKHPQDPLPYAVAWVGSQREFDEIYRIYISEDIGRFACYAVPDEYAAA